MQRPDDLKIEVHMHIDGKGIRDTLKAARGVMSANEVRAAEGLGPVYRFHGHTRPDPDARTPVVENMADVVSLEEGVATLRLYDPIDSWGGEWGVSAKEFARALDSLPDDTSEIRLHINSPGGEVYEGLAILNLLRNHKARVVAVIDGLAASAASFVAAGADEVVMGQNTQLMIHDAWGLTIGSAADMRDMARRLDQISNNIANVYAGKAGGSTEDWRGAMLAESWYNADEAVTAGLADRVEGTADPEAKNKFDLSVFAHEGREDAPAPPMPTAAPEPEAIGPSELMKRKHRMNARRFAS